MADQEFTGDRKAPLRSPLARGERWLIDHFVHRFPRWIEGWHLTLLTIAWTGGIVGFGFLAREDLRWLWGSSAMLFAQWLTDSFDGALGRLRDFGIPRWGFYMDHMLDFVFMWCVFAAYAFVLGDDSQLLVVIWAFIYAAMMASSFLDYGASGSFKITHMGLGPTEIRLAFIGLNTALIVFGTRFLELALPWVVLVFAGGLVVMVFRTQRRIWREERPPQTD
jgi:phosphatidylglycerophosphate synthase